MNLRQLNTIRFPDGHQHLKLNEPYTQSEVSISIHSFDDLFLLAQLKQLSPTLEVLNIKYLLGARCDRRFSKMEVCDLKIIADFINRLNFKKVLILKPHSDVALALIDNSEPVSVTSQLLSSCLFNHKISDYSIVSPDAGASKWIKKELGASDVIQCNKERNEGNGEIESITFSQTPKNTCIIVDDLCDGGKTFIELAEHLKERGVNKIYLIVTHAIFSKGLKDLTKHIDHIYCTDSYMKIVPTDEFSSHNEKYIHKLTQVSV